MLYLLYCGFYVLVINKIKGRLQTYLIGNSIKMIKYTPKWHRENDYLLDMLEWILC